MFCLPTVCFRTCHSNLCQFGNTRPRSFQLQRQGFLPPIHQEHAKFCIPYLAVLHPHASPTWSASSNCKALFGGMFNRCVLTPTFAASIWPSWSQGGNDTIHLKIFAAPPTSSVSDYQRHSPTQSVLVTIHLHPHSIAFGLPMPAFPMNRSEFKYHTLRLFCNPTCSSIGRLVKVASRYWGSGPPFSSTACLAKIASPCVWGKVRLQASSGRMERCGDILNRCVFVSVLEARAWTDSAIGRR